MSLRLATISTVAGTITSIVLAIALARAGMPVVQRVGSLRHGLPDIVAGSVGYIETITFPLHGETAPLMAAELQKLVADNLGIDPGSPAQLSVRTPEILGIARQLEEASTCSNRVYEAGWPFVGLSGYVHATGDPARSPRTEVWVFRLRDRRIDGLETYIPLKPNLGLLANAGLFSSVAYVLGLLAARLRRATAIRCRDPRVCAMCGYTLHDSTSARCSECGSDP